jgi:hypothetical protein
MPLHGTDSIYPANLPGGADFYIAYPDGAWPTAAQVKREHPGAEVIVLAVFASSVAMGYDGEKGDITPEQMPSCVRRSVAAGYKRPVVYCSIASAEDYLGPLAAAGIPRSAIRLISAHYDAGQHICGPSTCLYYEKTGLGITPQCDGTQYTDKYPGLRGSLIDATVLADSFFGGTMSPTGPEKWDDKDWAAMAAKGFDAGRDYGATATLWWLTHAVQGSTTASMTPGQVAEIQAFRAAVLALVPAGAPVPSADAIAAAVVAKLPTGTPAEEAVILGVKAALAQIFAPAPPAVP